MLFNLGVTINLAAAVHYAGVTLAFLNTCVNPIIYTAQYRQFQVIVKDMFCGKTSSNEDSVATASTAVLASIA